MDKPRIEHLAARYLAERLPYRSQKTAAEYRRLWLRDIVPAFAGAPVATLERDAVATWHRGRRSRPYAANRALNLLAHGCTLAELWGWRPAGSNPCRGVERWREQPRRRFFQPVELESLGSVLRRQAAAQRIKPQTRDAIHAVLLTGARKSEILALAWRQADASGASGWVDLEAGVLRITRAKGGPREIRLGDAALDLFAGILARREDDSSPWVFPGHKRGTHLQGLQRAWERLRKGAGILDARVHDLRKTFSTALRSHGVPLEDIADFCGHRDITTTRASYAFLTDDHQRRIANAAGALLAPFRGA